MIGLSIILKVDLGLQEFREIEKMAVTNKRKVSGNDLNFMFLWRISSSDSTELGWIFTAKLPRN